MGKTLYQKVWDAHTVSTLGDGRTQLFIGTHLIHEVTSPQAFGMIRDLGLKVKYPHRTFATIDHIVPTVNQDAPADPLAADMMTALRENADEFGVTYFDLASGKQGIVHVVGPEQGITQPGSTIACGDSHTATHGAFGALAFGIGTSEVEHVLATQTLQQKKPKTMLVEVSGTLPDNVTAKDIILAIIGKIGTAGGTGYVIEYSGEAIRNLSMEGRMTLCNMTIEAGARAGMVAPDEKTFEYVKGRDYAPQGEAFEKAVEAWKKLPSDEGAVFDETVRLTADEVFPQVTWGTNPGMVTDINGKVPDPSGISDPAERESIQRALEYMGLEANVPVKDIQIDRVFIGSCTNSRIEDLRAVAGFVEGKKVSGSVAAMIVPGSGLVKQQAESEGLNTIFENAGFEWREPGCSMCLAMNDDVLKPGERCASTSNRNFEGRQGKGSRTHLVSPIMAAAAAIAGTFADPRTL